MSEVLFSEFPPVSTEEWERAISEDLDAAGPAKLHWQTEDAISVAPFYRADPSRPAGPILGPGRSSWEIRAEITEENVDSAHREALLTLEHGAEGLVFRNTGVRSAAEFEALLMDLPLQDISISFVAGERGSDLAAWLNRSDRVGVLRGSVDADGPLPQHYRHLIRADEWSNSGATPVQELAFSIAAGVERLAEHGRDSRSAFLFTIGSSYFTEIAKLRAARLLWAEVAKAFESEAEMWIDAVTSAWNQTIYDPYVNILRGTTEAMSAIAGGCDSLVVLPFTGTWRPPDDLSRRLALNTQFILQEEAHFGRVADPAAGSWFIEELTNELAAKAWTLFQQVEAKGGLRQAVASGFVESTIQAARDARDARVAHRKRVFVGTSEYPDTAEHTGMTEAPKGRGSVPFEELRIRTERSGRATRVLLFTDGDHKMSQARAEFAANFFACAGFESVVASSLGDVPAADLIVLCSSDREYPELAARVLPASNAPVLIAGQPQDIRGVADYVHSRTNAVEFLRRWQQRLGIGTDHAA